MRTICMRLRWLLALACSIAAMGLLPKAGCAETLAATTLTPDAVWDAINSAKDGDVVQLPAGTALWKKGWNTDRWSKMRAITIQGAGIDKTIIRDGTSTAAGDEPFEIKGAEGKPFRIAEIYDNAFSAEGAKIGRPQGFIFISGGVAIVFNNTVKGTSYNCHTIELSHERSFRSIGEFGICDGTNPIDGNQIPAGQKGAGYPAFGQPGRATDALGLIAAAVRA